MPERHFVKYTFLKVDPAWRRQDADRRAADKREFLAACEDFGAERLLRAFSTVGTRGDCDLMLLSQATNLERIHEFHVVLSQSGLMQWCSVPHSFLDLVQRLRTSESSSYTKRDTPTFTCVSTSVERALGALDGTPLTDRLPVPGVPDLP